MAWPACHPNPSRQRRRFGDAKERQSAHHTWESRTCWMVNFSIGAFAWHVTRWRAALGASKTVGALPRAAVEFQAKQRQSRWKTARNASVHHTLWRASFAAPATQIPNREGRSRGERRKQPLESPKCRGCANSEQRRRDAGGLSKRE